jgi:hypothetical protein
MFSMQIQEADWHRIARFVGVFLATMGAAPAGGVPPDMVAGPPNADGWVPWKTVDSPVGDDDIIELEGAFGVQLPPLFRAYLMYKCLLATDFGILALPRTPSDRPLDEMVEVMELINRTPFWRTNKLLPFGYDGNGGGWICFDTARPSQDGDYPIMLVEYDRLAQPGYRGQEAWGSFRSMLDALEAMMLSYQ